jgi:hypothetical protein
MTAMDPMEMPAAEAVRIAAEAKTKVMRGGVRGGAHAACGLSVLEVAAMARVLDALLIDAFPAPRSAAAPARPRAVSDL